MWTKLTYRSKRKVYHENIFNMSYSQMLDYFNS